MSQQTLTHTPPKPRSSDPEELPPWRVLLHNDDINAMEYVVQSILMITSLGQQEALDCMAEAHSTGVALLLVCHQERAELYCEQFTSRCLTVTVEPQD